MLVGPHPEPRRCPADWSTRNPRRPPDDDPYPDPEIAVVHCRLQLKIA